MAIDALAHVAQEITTLDSGNVKEHGVVWLRNHDVFTDIASLDPATGVHWRFSIPKREWNVIDGWFAFLGGNFTAIYVNAGKLFIFVSGMTIPFGEDVRVEVNGPPDDRELRIALPDGDAVRLRYKVDLSRIFADDPTPCIELEDFDFGVFLANLSEKPQRKESMVRRSARN